MSNATVGSQRTVTSKALNFSAHLCPKAFIQQKSDSAPFSTIQHLIWSASGHGHVDKDGNDEAQNAQTFRILGERFLGQRRRLAASMNMSEPVQWPTSRMALALDALDALDAPLGCLSQMAPELWKVSELRQL